MILASYVLLPTPYFLLPTSYSLLPTSYSPALYAPPFPVVRECSPEDAERQRDKQQTQAEPFGDFGVKA